jgi:hypothetical protein
MEEEFPLSPIESLCNRLPDVVFQNTLIFRVITLRKSNNKFLLLLSVCKTFRSEVKTGCLDAGISSPTALFVIELPFYFITDIRVRTCTISKYNAVAAVQTCIQDVPYSSLDQATGYIQIFITPLCIQVNAMNLFFQIVSFPPLILMFPFYSLLVLY